MPALRTADGRRLTYRTLGTDGPTLVCHPGGPGFSSRYLGDLGGLDRDHRLVLLDPRGTGGSDRPADASAYGFFDYAADVEALRLHLGLERLALLGHSHGGCVAMTYAAQRPERVSALVLASTVARFDEVTAAAQAAAVEAHAGAPWFADATAALASEADEGWGSDAELAEVVARMLPLYFANFDTAAAAYVATFAGELPVADALRHFNRVEVPEMDLCPGLSRLDVPTMVVAGAADFICGPVCARTIAGAIPGAELVIVDGAGHFVFAEAAERFRGAVAPFLQRELAVAGSERR